MAAYSLDLRQRVVRACASGLSVTQVAKAFDVSRAWAYRLVSASARRARSHRARKQSFDAVPCRRPRRSAWSP